MADESAFRAAVLAAPDDDGPRLVYADWLEERGDPYGELIRTQCKLAGLPGRPGRPGRPAAWLRRREAELLADRAARRRLALPKGFTAALVWRGFVEAARCKGDDYCKRWRELLAAQPVREVTVRTWPRRELWPQAAPELLRLRAVRLPSDRGLIVFQAIARALVERLPGVQVTCGRDRRRAAVWGGPLDRLKSAGQL
jgi:uncharacterized protein (TIGR02996 family)